MQDGLAACLRAFGTELRRRGAMLGDRAILRERILRAGGRFVRLGGAGDYPFGSAPLVAVDGSTHGFGGSYPYVVYLFRAAARSSRGERVVEQGYLSPLVAAHREEVAQVAAREGVPREHALLLVRDRQLCRLEVRAATAAVGAVGPGLVLFDGGFLRYAHHAPEEWEEYCRTARAAGAVSVGVIEEAASSGLARAVVGEGFFDRDLLFGLLDPGEALFPAPVKRGVYTVFARLSRHPQPVACDFLPEHSQQAPAVMEYLYRITPSDSRGIPLFLDLVDAEVRLDEREVELLLTTWVEADLRERFLVPHRARRTY
jgi:hypothetical protein